MEKFLVIICVVLVGLQVSAEEVEQRSYFSPDFEILRVSSCTEAIEYKDFAGNLRVKSEFVVSLCKEQITYDVNLVSPETGYSWAKEEEFIDGSEIFNYITQGIRKGIDELVDPLDRGQKERMLEECQSLQEGYAAEVASLNDSLCLL